MAGKKGAAAGGKKGKKGKKGKEKKDPNALNNVNRVFCELTITDLNKKLARLRTTVGALDEHNVALKEEMRSMTYDRKDVAAYLTRTLEQRNAEYETLEEEHLKLIKLRETEIAMYEAKIKDMDAMYKAMNNQLTSEIKLITGKLHSLDEFRLERDELYMRFEDVEDEMHEQEKLSKQALVEIEQRGIVETNMLKKDIELKLLNVAEDFTRSNEIRHAGYTRRLIRENIALQKEIDQMVVEQIKMNQDFNEYVFRNKEIVQNYTALEDTNKDLMLKGQMQIEVIEKLTKTCEKLKAQYTEVLKYRDAYNRFTDIDECKKFNYKQVSKKLRALGQRIEMFKLERSEMASQIEQQAIEITNLRSVICKLKNSIELVIGARKEESIGSDSSYYMEEGAEEFEDDRSFQRRQNRQSLLSELLVIVNSCKMPEKSELSSARRSTSSVYHPGKIGFVLGVPKESLIDIMYDNQRSAPSTSRSTITSQQMDWHVENLKIPGPCTVPGNELFDVELGSDFFVSSSRDDKKMVIMEEQEPLDMADDGEESSSDIVAPVSSSSSAKEAQQQKAAPKRDDFQLICDVVDQEEGEEGSSGEEEANANYEEYSEEDQIFFF